jgi:hypothetical protein
MSFFNLEILKGKPTKSIKNNAPFKNFKKNVFGAKKLKIK